MSHRFTNKLVSESSLYLRQHAHNPVNWYPWGEEALERARSEGKPILVSIGYAACHWCHVMERESFEDEQVAAFMNSHFISIKIDREERPDLDHIYMDAVQAMTGSGGWPLNVFCTPDTRPFFGGTYFPPSQAFNRISWMELLQRIQQAWENKREGLEQQAGRIFEHISTSAKITAAAGGDFNGELCGKINDNILNAADKIKGGFGAAPKFPHTLTIRYLLEYARAYGDNRSREQAELSLRQMIRGGIYDHLGGGLARYSTDDDWLVPHFEKMLYDNALLISALSMAFMLTQDREYADAIRKTTGFLKNEMLDIEGGYYSAIDADSEGVEGKYYVWSKEEIDSLLGEDTDVYCRFYGVSETGNWEGVNILHVHSSAGSFASEHGLSLPDLEELIESGNKKLLVRRAERPRPLTDDKILLGWNALLISAYCRAFAATGEESYRRDAKKLADFVFKSFEKGDQLFHCYYHGSVSHPAFLDDIAYLIEACILLQEITGEQHYLNSAEKWTGFSEENFLLESGFFSYTNRSMKDLLFRKTEYYDGAMPSGNSTMAINLFFLGRLLDKGIYTERAEKMLSAMSDLVIKFPISFSLWASFIIYKSLKNTDLVVTGKDINEIRSLILGIFMPGRIFQSSDISLDFPLLKGKDFNHKKLIYLCINSLCFEPFNNLNDLQSFFKKQES